MTSYSLPHRLYNRTVETERSQKKNLKIELLIKITWQILEKFTSRSNSKKFG
ncbi:hypothetical protein TTHERM_00602890 (macronuclear) [Tetrahymena thermophila SB210]|uniref:Uncharacterized protein n=1 Tax=Tetrahymena thermophila (strain SB210) TaxID=312017 RepID=Q22YK6_TETTS|nr:hypothetical protein TTHERM_00602890 [Tetrahymena thermophila SB210]EAR90279.2 hypothetical protein TTHERM_00602890 [Tetrahymena thermophila SB210]|eukprot:XP_001010524.2 hypothetical protein TTHERM_00602890 [Tetrahymena thermophila SB210]